MFYRAGTQPNPVVHVKHGWFDNIAALKEFLAEFNQIMHDSRRTSSEWYEHLKFSGDFGSVSLKWPLLKLAFFVKVKPTDAEPLYYSTQESSGLNVIGKYTVQQLNELINNAKIVAPLEKPVPKKDNSKPKQEGISLKIVHNSVTKGVGAVSDLHINTNGDIKLKVRTVNEVHFEVEQRTSPLLFKQLEDIVVYSKHAKQIPELDKECEENSFNLKYLKNGKGTSYYYHF